VPFDSLEHNDSAHRATKMAKKSDDETMELYAMIC
jgi:hypothetical protein